MELLKASLGAYNLLPCSTVSEIRPVYDDGYISLVVLDIGAAGFDCFSLFKEFRIARPWLSGIVIADEFDETLLRRVFDYGFSSFIERPLHPDIIRTRVRESLVFLDFQSEATRLKTLLPLYEMGEQFLRSTTEQEVLDGLLEAVRDLVDSNNVSVMLYNEEEECLRIEASLGFDPKLVPSIRVAPGDKISGWVYQNRRPVILNKNTQDSSFFAPLLKRPDIESAVSVPMMIRGKILGVLNLNKTRGQAAFSEADTELLAVVCSQASLALENVRSLKAMEERMRMRTLFERYVAPEVAELLISRDSDLMDLGEVRDVTVLFADIRNFTGIVQKLELREIRTFLNELYNLFTEKVFLNKGMVDKFMGDAVLAVFGAPVELAKSSCSAADSALAIRDNFEELKRKWVTYNPEFQNIGLGIGITRGEMFLGNVGSVKRFDYTVIGTQVNIAQRLASEASFREIYITDEVKRAVDNEYCVSSVGVLELRGLEEKKNIYKVECRKT